MLTFRPTRSASLGLLLALAAFAASIAQVGKAPKNPEPGKQIDLAALGYGGLSPLARFTGKANISLDFIDANRVLVTFNAQKLLVRHPECPPTHADRMIHALVLDIHSGAIVTEADWYVHDSRKYLWPLGGGRFLLRKLNSIYLVDSGLKEKLLFDSPSELLWTGVTADGKQIILETASGEPQGAKKPDKPDQAARTKAKIVFLDVDSLEVKKAFSAAEAARFESSSSGYADAVHNSTRKLWLVRFGPSAADRKNLMRLRSPCEPDLLFPTDETLFVGRCAAKGPEYSVSVFTLSGHFLWRQRWDQLQHTPAVVSSEDGSRMAVSTITASRDSGSSNPSGEEEVGWPDVEQEIRVLETASGNEVLSTGAKNVVLNNRNFSLSPDGLQLAVIDGTILNICDLRPMSADERAKYLAMKAGSPDLAAPVSFSAETGDQREEAQSQPDDFQNGEEVEKPSFAAPVRRDEAASGSDGQTPESPWSPSPNAKPVSQASSEPGVTTFRARAEEVIVDVVVTDSKGHPVKGLSKQDFQLEEDGKRQNVMSLREFGDEAPPKTVPSAPPPANVFDNNKTIAPDQSVGVILLDFLNTEPSDQEYAKEQFIKFLRKKPPGMQFALCTLTDRLQLVQGFTADENLLLANLHSKRARNQFSPQLRGIQFGQEIQSAKERAEIDASAESFVQMLVKAQATQRALELDRRVALTADAFSQLARYLSSIPGRKSLVWLSGSFPGGFLGSTSINVDTANQSVELRTYSDQIRKTTNLLADAHIAVYPVNTHALSAGAIPGAEDNTSPLQNDLPGSHAPVPAGVQVQTDAGTNKASAIVAPSPLQQELAQRNDTRVAEEAAMDRVADETGGKALQSTNGLSQAIETAIELGSHYYMLSYSPANRNYNGAFRKIRVSLTRKGYHLAHRRGYYAIDPESAAGDVDLNHTMSSAAMERGAPQSHQLVFAARVVPIGKPRKTKNPSAPASKTNDPEKALVEMQRYSIDYAIAASEVRFAENAGIRRSRLLLMTITFGDKSQALNRSAAESASSFNARAYQDAVIGGLRVHQEFEVPVAAASLRLGVEDLLSGRLGTLELSLPLSAPPDQGVLRARELPPIEPN